MAECSRTATKPDAATAAIANPRFICRSPRTLPQSAGFFVRLYFLPIGSVVMMRLRSITSTDLASGKRPPSLPTRNPFEHRGLRA